MKEIQLTQGYVALVDDENYEWINGFKWCMRKDRNNVYAKRAIRVNGRHKTIQMHYLIMGENPLKLMIDHRDGDGLNNRKENLRFCTNQENQMNSRSQKNSSSIHKGVYWNKKDGKWMARICISGHQIYLGSFDIEVDAAIAYNTAAIKYYGEFAKLNIII